MTKEAPEYLFVYGSLRPDIGNDISDLLAREAQVVGAATISGDLYHLGWYPGLQYKEESGRVVQGYVLQLYDARSLEWLDDYEGFDPAAPQDALFIRIKAEAKLVNSSENERCTCWVYHYPHEVNSQDRVDSGDWKIELEKGIAPA